MPKFGDTPPPPIPEPEIKKEARIHPWVYTIIPFEGLIIFTAYCKACRSYFTEAMPFDRYGKAKLDKSALPRYGCEPISEDVNLI